MSRTESFFTLQRVTRNLSGQSHIKNVETGSLSKSKSRAMGMASKLFFYFSIPIQTQNIDLHNDSMCCRRSPRRICLGDLSVTVIARSSHSTLCCSFNARSVSLHLCMAEPTALSLACKLNLKANLSAWIIICQMVHASIVSVASHNNLICSLYTPDITPAWEDATSLNRWASLSMYRIQGLILLGVYCNDSFYFHWEVGNKAVCRNFVRHISD